MSTPSYSWPEEIFPSDQVRAWLSAQFGGPVVGPVRVLYAKQWGVTASFTVTPLGRSVVFKGSRHPAAAHGPSVHRFLADNVPDHVPAVLAGRIDGDTAWTVFEPLDGPVLEDHLDRSGFVQLASTFAAVQAALAGVPIPSAMPRSPLRLMPATLDRFGEAIGNHLQEWDSEGTGPQSASARSAAELLASIRPRVVAASQELADSGWLDSIDHVDLNVSNVFIQDGRMVIIDWEEALVGFPACSLDRLLDDAREYDGVSGGGVSPTGRALIEAYAGRVPWGSPEARSAVVHKATRLNRVAFAGQALDFWQARGRPFGHPKLMAFCTDRILEVWAPETA